jgi:hypothetical protein
MTVSFSGRTLLHGLISWLVTVVCVVSVDASAVSFCLCTEIFLRHVVFNFLALCLWLLVIYFSISNYLEP